jgi:hypothetical protein
VTEDGQIPKAFLDELTHLINRHSIENVADTPDFLLAGMICRMIEAMGPSIKKTLDWRGCSSVCHPSPTGQGYGSPSQESDSCPPYCCASWMRNRLKIRGRITEVMELGGLFNPEMMDHEKVRDLLIDCREWIDAQGEMVSRHNANGGLSE